MWSRSFIVAGALASALASGGCSGGGDSPPGSGGGAPVGDGRAFVPEDLPNTEVGEQPGGLTLVAFTLERGSAGLELYAAVKNEDTDPACNIGMMVEFYDRAQNLVTSVGGSVSSGRFYRLDDGSGAVLSCLPPGQVGMAAVTELPSEILLEELGSLKHNFPAFEVGGAFLDGVSIGKLTTVATDGGSKYQGTLANGLDVTLGAPAVTVFPVNRVGRPLGVATATASTDVTAGGTWSFETTPVRDPGVGYAAYASGSVSP